MTAYFMWLNDNRERIIAQLGGKGGPEVTKKGSEMWKALTESEKKSYEDTAKRAKEEYDSYISTDEGAAALKAYKDATAAVAYKPKAVDDADQNGSPEKAAAKRSIDDAPDAIEAPRKRGRPAKIAKAGA